MCRYYLMVIDLWRKDHRLCLQSSPDGARSRIPARVRAWGRVPVGGAWPVGAGPGMPEALLPGRARWGPWAATICAAGDGREGS